MQPLNYSLHYSIWHTEKTREHDINYAKSYLQLHSLFPSDKDARILDIGCALGNYLLAFQQEGFSNCEGVELDSHLAESCRKQGMRVTEGTGRDFLSQTNSIYDAIILFDVLEHIAKEEQFSLIQNAYKHLSETGFLAISVPNALAPLSFSFFNIDWTHHCSFTPISLQFLLLNAGFHHSTFRPSHQESIEIRQLKKPWIDLYKAEFNIDNPILTPSLMSISFKSEAKLLEYQATAKDLLSFSTSSPKQDTFIRRSKRAIKETIKKILS